MKLSHLKHFSGFKQNPNETEVFGEFLFPKQTVKGHYKIDGKVLDNPITGDGKFENVAENVKTTIGWRLKTVEVKDGKTFVKPEKLTVKYEIEKYVKKMFPIIFINTKFYFRAHVNLHNLFGGNKDLEDTMNKLINDNWKSLLEISKPTFDKVFLKLVQKRLEDFYQKFPYEEFWLPTH